VDVLTLDQQYAHACQQRDRCLDGIRDASDGGSDLMWLMGWADWSIEVEILKEQLDKECTNTTISAVSAVQS